MKQGQDMLKQPVLLHRRWRYGLVLLILGWLVLLSPPSQVPFAPEDILYTRLTYANQAMVPSQTVLDEEGHQTFLGTSPAVVYSRATLSFKPDVVHEKVFRWQSSDPMLGDLATGFVMATTWVVTGTAPIQLTFRWSGAGVLISGTALFAPDNRAVVDVIRGAKRVRYLLTINPDCLLYLETSDKGGGGVSLVAQRVPAPGVPVSLSWLELEVVNCQELELRQLYTDHCQLYFDYHDKDLKTQSCSAASSCPSFDGLEVPTTQGICRALQEGRVNFELAWDFASFIDAHNTEFDYVRPDFVFPQSPPPPPVEPFPSVGCFVYMHLPDATLVPPYNRIQLQAVRCDSACEFPDRTTMWVTPVDCGMLTDIVNQPGPFPPCYAAFDPILSSVYAMQCASVSECQYAAAQDPTIMTSPQLCSALAQGWLQIGTPLQPGDNVDIAALPPVPVNDLYEEGGGYLDWNVLYPGE